MMQVRLKSLALFVFVVAATLCACSMAVAQLDVTLSNGGVTPASATQYSQFRFTLTYTEAGNQGPLPDPQDPTTVFDPINWPIPPLDRFVKIVITSPTGTVIQRAMKQTNLGASYYIGGVEFEDCVDATPNPTPPADVLGAHHFVPGVDGSAMGLSDAQLLGTWSYHFEVRTDAVEPTTIERFPDTGELTFQVTPSVPSTMTLQAVDENGIFHRGGMTIEDPFYNPSYDDSGSSSSTFVWRIRYSGGADPYPWLEYLDDTWADPRNMYWGYNAGANGTTGESLEPYPFRFTTGVVLYTRSPDDPGVWRPHFMYPDPVLPDVYSYVATPILPDGLAGNTPRLEGIKYGSLYNGLAFTGGDGPADPKVEYFYVICTDNANPFPTLGTARQFIVLDTQGVSIFGVNGGLWPFDPDTQINAGQLAPFPVESPTESPSRMRVHPTLNQGWFKPNNHDQSTTGPWYHTRARQDQVIKFRVNYQGAAGSNPTIKVCVTGDPTDTIGQGHIMTPMTDTQDLDYVAGAYTYSMALPPGQHYVFWEANDGTRTTRFPRRPDGVWPHSTTPSAFLRDLWRADDVTDPVWGHIGNDHGGWWQVPGGGPIFADLDPRVNFRSVLSNASVTPTSGGKGTSFVYKVKYQDADPGDTATTPAYLGDPPRWAKLVFVGPGLSPPNDHIIVDMTKSTDTGDNPNPNNYQAGVVYKYVANNLPDLFAPLNGGQPLYGTYRYYFEFTDNWGRPPDPSISPEQGEMVRFPQGTESFAGPTITLNQAPELTPGVPSYESTDGSNTTATLWVFRVKYVDGDNDAPAWIKVFIDDAPELEDGMVMTKQDATDNIYTDGVIYEYKARVAVNAHDFHFAASDGIDTDRTDDIAMAAVGANTVPHLSNGLVTPTAGTSATEFVYSVTYLDYDAPRGQAPSYIQVYIDGTAFNMTKVNPGDNDYTEAGGGANYEYRTTLAVKSHTYHFDASDGAGRVVWSKIPPGTVNVGHEYRDGDPEFPMPTTILDIDGPSVNNPPVLTNLTLTPSTGTPTTEFNFRVTYSDPEGNPPSTNYPAIWIDDATHEDAAQHRHSMVKADPSQTNYVGGVDYIVMVNGEDMGDGQHSFHAQAISVGDGVTSNVRSPAAQETSGPKVKHRPNLDVGVAPDILGVTPMVGNEGTAFQFRVRYTDNFNLSPSFVRVVVMKKHPTEDTYTQIGVKAMVREVGYASNNGVYTDGEVYVYPDPAKTEQYKLQVGDYKYYFVANDRTEDSQLPNSTTPANWFDFTVEDNQVPTLSEPAIGTVSPVTGNYNSIYTYYIEYTDPNNNPPSYIKVHIDGSVNGVAMAKVNVADNDYDEGVTYFYAAPVRSLARGVAHTYRFTASDGLVNVVFEDPDTHETIQEGPIVGNGTPVLSNASVVKVLPPGSNESNEPIGTSSDQYTWEVTYTDPDGDAPSYVRLFLDGASDLSQALAMAKRADQGSNYAAGVVYTYTSAPRTLAGDPDGLLHTYQITAADAYVADQMTATPVNGNGPTVASALFENLILIPEPVDDEPLPRILLGEAIQVRGNLNVGGAVPGETTIVLTFVGPDGSGESINVTMDANNRFSYTFRPTVRNVGGANWRVRVYWSGDDAFGEIWQDMYFDVLAVTSPEFTPGSVYMISVPLTPIDPNISTLFGDVYSQLNLIKWLPTTSEYVMYNQTPTLFPAPTAGSGYWIKPTGVGAFSFEPFGSVPSQETAYVLGVARGWNQIGSVFFDSINIGDIMVQYQGNVYDLDTASTMNPRLVGNWAWRYDTILGTYTLVQSTAASASNRVLEPWVGYWVRAFVDGVSIILNPAAQRSREGSGPTRSGAEALVAKSSGWSVRLEANAGRMRDMSNYLGVSGTSVAESIESPAYLEGYVDLRFTGATRGSASDPLAVDLRADEQDTMTWEFEVASDQPNQSVRLTWPQLASTPKAYTFTLYDVDANKSKFMRTSTYYEFNTGDAKSTRHFKVVADKKGGGMFMITNVIASRSRGATAISYNLTREAEVQVKVTDLRGRVLRTLVSRAATTGGLNTVTWDEKDGQGRRVPRGLYVVEVQGRTEDGQSSRAVQTVNIGQ